jgi:hypothetical protein
MTMMMKSSIPTGSHDSDVDVEVEIMAPLTRSKMIQERSSSSFGDNLGILFYDDPNSDDNNNQRRPRTTTRNSDVRELAGGALLFVTGWYGPRYLLLPYLFAHRLDQNQPPFQTTKAGDVIVDFFLNQPLIDPPTIPGA